MRLLYGFIQIRFGRLCDLNQNILILPKQPVVLPVSVSAFPRRSPCREVRLCLPLLLRCYSLLLQFAATNIHVTIKYIHR